jgi:hypothetical protein
MPRCAPNYMLADDYLLFEHHVADDNLVPGLAMPHRIRVHVCLDT